MGTSKDTIADVLDALGPLRVRARAMFGEYALYCDEKVVALVCDDRLFLKPTAQVDGAALGLEPCPPYPGAKDHWLVDERAMRDRESFRRLVQSTADALPAPRPRRRRGRRGGG